MPRGFGVVHALWIVRWGWHKVSESGSGSEERITLYWILFSALRAGRHRGHKGIAA